MFQTKYDGWRPLRIPKKQTDSLLISGKKSKASSCTPLINMAFVILKTTFFEQIGFIRQASLIHAVPEEKYELAYSEVVLVSATMPHEVLEMTHKLLGFRVLEWKRSDEPKLDHAIQVKFLTDSIMMDFNFSVRILLLILLPRKRKMEAEDHPLEKENHIPNFHFGVQDVGVKKMIGDRPSTLSFYPNISPSLAERSHNEDFGIKRSWFQNVLEPSSFYFRMTFQWFCQRKIIAFLNHGFI